MSVHVNGKQVEVAERDYIKAYEHGKANGLSDVQAKADAWYAVVAAASKVESV